jgi:glycosyltransferase involved in cell wall biosynthesis
VHAESTKKELKQWYAHSSKNVFLIPFSTYNGYSEAYKYGYSKEKAREELGLPKDKFIYLFFGYVRKYKGIDILIKAFQRAKPDNSVLLIGGGYWTDADKAEIERVVKNDTNIILHTQEMTDTCVQQHMAAADVVVLPYRRITTSGVLVLALTFGKPIIAVKKGMLPEWVSAENGIVVETEQNLQRALHEIQKKDLRAMGEVSYTLSQKYPWSRVARLYEEVYEKVLNEKKEQREKNGKT